MEKAICKKCGFEDEYESEQYGLTYYEAIGKCYHCNSDTFNDKGELTRKEITFKLINI